MLIFYYGLLFLATLCISDGAATFLVLCIVDFLIGKAIWQDYEPFVTWRKKKYEQLIELKTWGSALFLEKWEEASLLKRTYIIVAGVVGFALSILFVHLYLEVLWISWNDIGGDDKIRNLALAFIGTITGIGALFGVYLAILRSEELKRQNDVAEEQSKTAIQQSKIANAQSRIANKQSQTANRQANTAEQGLITDRINKAVESLGKINGKDEPLREVRLGALYALERIAQDSLRDHIRIMKIMCAYIRVSEQLGNSTDETKPVKEDIRAALIIIGKRGEWTEDQEHLKEEEKQKYKLDLRCCNLHNADLIDTNLSDGWLISATLEEAFLAKAKLNNADLARTNFTNATLNKTNFNNAYTRGAFAYEGDFSQCLNLTQEQLDDMFCGFDVVINKMDALEEFDRPDHWPKTKLSEDAFIEKYKEWMETRWPTYYPK